MTDHISLEGPIELEGDKLVIRIPLDVGGDRLAPLAKGIGDVQGEELVVIVQPWLAKALNIEAGNLVVVDNANGKFNITRSSSNDVARADEEPSGG